jgi:hypothetical protein
MADTLEEIGDAIERSGLAADRAAAIQAAREWVADGFDDSSEVEEWLAARCLTPQAARLADDAGLTPSQAAARTRAGAGSYEDTVGYKLSRGDLTLAEARRIITSDFWND